MSINTEGGFFQGCAKKGGFNPGGVLSWGGSFLPPRFTCMDATGHSDKHTCTCIGKENIKSQSDNLIAIK